MGEGVSELRKIITTPKLSISRMPEKTYKAFVKLADEEFCSDYGFTLKYLLDFYFGAIAKGNEHLEIGLETLAVELEKLKQIVFKNEQKPTKTRLDGTGGKENGNKIP